MLLTGELVSAEAIARELGVSPKSAKVYARNCGLDVVNVYGKGYQLNKTVS